MPALQRKPTVARRRQVALLIETSNAYARGLLQGIVHYIREHRPWSFHLMEQGRGDDPPAWLANWHGDGMIARIPPLSSVTPDTHRTGYEAAALLDRLMSGRKVPPVAHLIPPLGVAARQSTDVLAVEDRDVARAVRLIREQACEGINVGDVLQAVPLSPRRGRRCRGKPRQGRPAERPAEISRPPPTDS